MLRTALAQVAASRARLAAAALAVVIGTAFVAATLLASGLVLATMRASVSAGWAGADVVVTAGSAALDDAVVARAAGAQGVLAAQGQRSAPVDLATEGRADFAVAGTAPAAGPLREATALEAGALPEAPGGVAVDADLAGRLGLVVGDALQVRWNTFAPPGADPASGQERTVATADVRVTGLLTPRADLTGRTPQVLGHPGDVDAWSTTAAGGPPAPLDQVLVVGEPGAAPAAVRDAVAGALDGTGASALTAPEQADRAVDEVTGGRQVLTAALLAFTAVAVLVAGVVVTNTLGVLVAQRRRELALLRCIGATRRQVRTAVLLEAGVLGLVASLAGVVLGTALAQVAAVVVSRLDLGPTPAAVTPTGASVLVPLAVGTLTTVLAALAPARAATRVAPLAALRPALPRGADGPASRVRLVATSLLLGGGTAVLALGVVVAMTGPTGPGSVLLGVLGGAASFVGVLVGAPLLLPPVVLVLGRGASRLGGVPTRLAAANAVRNPARTAVTASALLVGVTLVAMMTVGTASAERTIAAELDAAHPVDISVGAAGSSGTGAPAVGALDPALLAALDDAASAGAVGRPLVLAGAAVSAGGAPLQVLGVDADAAAGVVRDPSSLAGLAAGTVLATRWSGVDEGVGRLVLEGASGSLDARVVHSDLPGTGLLATPGDLARLDAAAAPTEVWLALPEGADEAAAVAAVEDAVAGAAGGAAGAAATPVDGAAVQRGDVTGALDAVLAVVLGLLGIAVVIALVGVGNTLSLSVLERTRESALLRAMGLTRGQLRRTLAVEGVLLAAVGAVVGVVLGTAYGWAGVLTVFGDALDTRLALPWQRLGLVVAAALAAGLLASVLPARRAALTPPAAALAE